MSFEVDRLLRDASVHEGAEPLIAYPSSSARSDQYRVYTGGEVNKLVYSAAQRLIAAGMDVVVGQP